MYIYLVTSDIVNYCTHTQQMCVLMAVQWCPVSLTLVASVPTIQMLDVRQTSAEAAMPSTMMRGATM